LATDVIGDIHGHADALEALLSKLGYSERGGAWRHPTNRALFLGDLIDRGPRQLAAVDIPRRMRDAGVADVLLANHEFNALAFGAERPHRPGEHYRPRTARNVASHRAFTEACGLDSPEHREVLGFFFTLPLWVEMPGFRAIHACWSTESMDVLRPWLDAGNRLTEDGFHATQEKGGAAYGAAEVLLKGPEADLPRGVSYRDHNRIERTRMRVKWWEHGAPTLRGVADVSDDVLELLPDTPFPSVEAFRYHDAKPLFFGHYWMRGEPRVIAANKACLDFSIASGGALCGYRFDGESELASENLVWVGALDRVPDEAPAP
jgi:hypothetical protein